MPESQGERAVGALRQTFRHEIEQGLIDGVTARPDMAVDRRRRRRHGRHARHFRARVYGARKRRHQRRGHRAGILRAQHFVRRRRRRRRRSGAPGPRRLSTLEDRRRPSAGASAHRCGAAGIWARRPRARRIRSRPADEPRRPHRRTARSIRLRVRCARNLAGARLLRLAQREGQRSRCCRRSAASRPTAAGGARRSWPSHAVSRPVVVDVTSEETGAAAADGDRSAASTSCSPTRSRWRDRREDYDRLLDGADRGRAARFAMKRRSAPGCR